MPFETSECNLTLFYNKLFIFQQILHMHKSNFNNNTSTFSIIGAYAFLNGHSTQTQTLILMNRSNSIFESVWEIQSL